jgi:hypothetical protein
MDIPARTTVIAVVGLSATRPGKIRFRNSRSKVQAVRTVKPIKPIVAAASKCDWRARAIPLERVFNARN